MMDSLPDIQLVEQKMTNFVISSNDELYDRISVTFKNIDARIVSMRKEFDVDSILKLITRKADGE